MKLEEYTASETFQREQLRLSEKKRTGKQRFIIFAIGLAVLLVGSIFLALSEEDVQSWMTIAGYTIFAVGSFIFFVGAILFSRTEDRRDNSFMRRPAFAVAFLLYAKEHLAAGWRAENGAVSYQLDFPAMGKRNMEIPSFALIRGGVRTEIDLSLFGEHLDCMDGLQIAQMSLFAWLDEWGVVCDVIRYRTLENGQPLAKKEVVLYEAGKWRWEGRMQRREYRYLVKYARKKGLL